MTRFATTCRECPAGCGMLLFSRDGRIIKAEGLPGHPVNDGALCPRGQSAPQGLYDPDRLRQPVARSGPGKESPVSWEHALERIAQRLKTGAGRAFVLSRPETGALAEILTTFAKTFGGRALFLDPFGYDCLTYAHGTVFGQAVIPSYLLDRCDFLLGFGAEFLEAWLSNVEFTRRFVRMRARSDPPGRYVHIGSRLSMTAANADLFIQVPAASEADMALAVLKVILERGWGAPGSQALIPLAAQLGVNAPPDILPPKRIEWLARQFAKAKASLALPGPVAARGPEARRLALAAGLLNKACGREGQTLDFSRVHALGSAAPDADLKTLAMELTEADTLFFHQTNPVYTRPYLAESLRRAGAGLKHVSLALLPDETSLGADFVLPVDSPLESWGDYEPWSGLTGLIQPGIVRLYDTRNAGDVFLSLAKAAGRPLSRLEGAPPSGDFKTWLTDSWHDKLPSARRTALRQGWMETPGKAEPKSPLPAQSVRAAALPSSAPDAPTLHFLAWPSVYLHDGSLSNRGWLQEAPEPVSGVAWGNCLDIHPGRARALNLKDGDLAEVASKAGAARAPVRITRDVAENAVALCLGQGHAALGRTAQGVGSNAFALFGPGEPDGLCASVTVTKAGSAFPVTPLATQEQHGRDLLRWAKLSDMAANRASDEITMPLSAGYRRDRDLYGGHEHAGHRWAMAIDLNRCVGCGACRVACYAENNIPVMGAKHVAEGREMAWMRVVAYRHPDASGRLGFLPLNCQHCDAAPCEPVCPVFASVNNEEGLNAQIYNRCIGSRYCAQNCPYKVRKFNWFDGVWPSPLHWQLNPEVTVRSRGVMEKCTFCVQRIRQAQYLARLEDREMKDLDAVPACMQTCPAGVFSFGDLRDPASEVSRRFREAPGRYQLLHELNTKPAVLFLKRIENDALLKDWEESA